MINNHQEEPQGNYNIPKAPRGETQNRFRKAKWYMPRGYYKPKTEGAVYNYFNLIYELHRDEIYKTFFRKLHDKDMSNELTQETFYRFWGKYGQLKDTEKSAAWLTKTAINLLRMNSRKSFAYDSILPKYQIISNEKTEIKNDQDLAVKKKDFNKIAAQGFHTLGKKGQVDLYLNECLGKNYLEIARELKKTRDAVKTRIKRQRKFLIKYLRNHDIDEDFLS